MYHFAFINWLFFLYELMKINENTACKKEKCKQCIYQLKKEF